MRILYCSNEQILPLLGGGSAGNLKIMEKFVERGHQVTVSTPLYIDPAPIEQRYGIQLRPFSPFPMHRTLSYRVPRYVAYSVLYLLHLQRLVYRERYDAIFLRNCILGPAVYLSRALFQVPVAISMTDIISGFLYESTLPKPLVDLFVFIERQLARRADRLFVITDEIRDALVLPHEQPLRQRVSVTYDGVDVYNFRPDRFTESDRAAIRAELGVSGPLVMYHGIIDPYHGIQVMREIIGQALATTDLSFLLIAKGVGYDQLKAELAGPRVICLDFIPYEEIPRYIYAADAGMIPYLPNFNLDKVLTLKLLEYLAMGANPVSFRLKAIDQLFGGSGAMGIADTVPEFVVLLQAAVGKPRCQDSVELIQREFSWDAVAGKIVDGVEGLVAARRG